MKWEREKKKRRKRYGSALAERNIESIERNLLSVLDRDIPFTYLQDTGIIDYEKQITNKQLYFEMKNANKPFIDQVTINNVEYGITFESDNIVLWNEGKSVLEMPNGLKELKYEGEAELGNYVPSASSKDEEEWVCSKEAVNQYVEDEVARFVEENYLRFEIIR